ncbi:hypothetical protein GRF29_8g1033270 [Pseudopithomyces chartarum]|uniref:Uncharacterized protein n=1 Tax=Pseudopithomyces chartarum TaxID=1892770 RepID=A0AAN6RL54_9PLEO|nr:hypothetical protein GRF29_8g1033270 [Pseudopithomyces chartarum]
MASAAACPVIGSTNSVLPPNHPDVDLAQDGQTCPVVGATTDHHHNLHKHPSVPLSSPTATECPALKSALQQPQSKAMDDAICPVVGTATTILPPDHPDTTKAQEGDVIKTHIELPIQTLIKIPVGIHLNIPNTDQNIYTNTNIDMSPTSQPKPTTTITKSNSSAPKPTGVQKHQSKKQKPHSILRYEDALKALYYKANDQQVWKNAAYQQGYQPTVYQHGYQQVYQQQVYLATSYQQGYPQQQVYQPPTQQVWSTPTYQQVHQPFTHHPLHTDAGFSAGLPPAPPSPSPPSPLYPLRPTK